MLLTLYNRDEEYKKDIEAIKKLGEIILNSSIDFQRSRENKVYKALGISISDGTYTDKDLKKIKEAIYVPQKNKIDNKDIETTIDQCMKTMIEYVDKLLTKYDERENYNLDINLPQNSIENVLYILKEFEEMINDSKKYYENKIDKINSLGNAFSYEELISLIGREGLKIKEILKITLDEEKDLLKGVIDPKRLEEITKNYTEGSKRSLIGAIGEAMAIYYGNIGDGKILSAFSTSDWYTSKEKRVRISQGRQLNDTIQLNDEELKQTFNKENSEAIKNIKKIVQNSRYESPKIKFKTGGDVKADEVYVVINPELKDELFYFGISNKTSYSESSNFLKVQTTSLAAIISNLYKISSLEKTGTISFLLKRLLINAIASNWGKIAISEFKNALGIIVDSYGEVWLTGGLENDKSRADFFSVYTQGNFEFIPMSFILEKIYQLSFEQNTRFFEPIAINESFKLDTDIELKTKFEKEIEYYTNKKGKPGVGTKMRSIRDLDAQQIIDKVSKPDAPIRFRHGIIF